MLASTLLTVALALSAQTKDGAPKKAYSLDTAGTSQQVQPGKPGTFRLAFKVDEGFYISPEAPLKIGLTADKIALEKKQLAHADAKDKTAKAPEFLVPFGTTEQCDTSIAVDAVFFLCNEKLCERKTEKLTVPVSVRP
ncbi:hypothetical protein L6R52_13200 [Myxococcota bacterium]|nr:hypothetical protein [Myxococcota bacterium]